MKIRKKNNNLVNQKSMKNIARHILLLV